MSVYHLHIPRTSGVFLREGVIRKTNKPMFVGHREAIPENLAEYEYISGHFATNPIKHFDINFAIYREPVELTFSYINYMRDIFYPQMSFDDLIEHYIATDKIQNFVNVNSTFLTGTMDTNKYNKMVTDLQVVAESGWYVTTNCKTLDNFVDNIQKNNTILVDYLDDQKYDKISAIYGVDYPNTKVNSSSKIDNETILKYNKLITELNSFDLEVYGYLSSIR